MFSSVIKMEFKVLFFAVLMCCVQTEGVVSAMSLKQLSEKIDLFEAILEKKLDFEIAQRQRDYENLMSKLGDITTQIETLKDKSTISANGKYSEEQKISVSGTIDSGKSEELLKYFINGIKTEKQLNGVIRREISSMGRALNDLNSRVTREVSRVDVRVTETGYKLEEHFYNLSISIENGLSMILSSQNDTRFMLHNENERSNGQLNKTINKAMNQMLTSENESRIVLHNKLNHLIKTHCDRNDSITEMFIEQLWTNMSTSLKEIHIKIPPFESCVDVFNKGHRLSGEYNVRGIKVWCDQTTDSGGWTVFQRRMDGSVDFYRDWSSYKRGFGDVSSEFWLGNDYLSEMLSRGNYELRIDMEDFDGNRAYAKYDSFRIDPESNNYTLHVGKFSGNRGDSLKYHNGQPFSTRDMDLDKSPSSCAKVFKGAWWYDNCHHSNLNGLYHVPPGNGEHTNVVWYHLKNTYNYSLKFVEMKFRRTDGA